MSPMCESRFAGGATEARRARRLPSSRPRQWQEESRVGLPGDWLPQPGSNILPRILGLGIRGVGPSKDERGGLVQAGRGSRLGAKMSLL